MSKIVTFRDVVGRLDPESVVFSVNGSSIWVYVDTFDHKCSIYWLLDIQCCPLRIEVAKIKYADTKTELIKGKLTSWNYRTVYEQYMDDDTWQFIDIHDCVVPPPWLQKRIHEFIGAELPF